MNYRLSFIHTSASVNKCRFGLLTLFILAFIITFTLPSSILGASAVSCHCFQDRSFDPDEPNKVEPYLMATTRNSFLAIAFNQSKKEIVRLRMAGTPGEDLWVAYYLALHTGIPAEDLLLSRSNTDSWMSVLGAQKIDPKKTGSFFRQSWSEGGNDQALANAAADDMLCLTTGTAPGDIRQFRNRDANTSEIILSLLIAQRLGHPAIEFHEKVQQGHATWGGLIDSVGIQPAEIEEVMKTFLESRENK